MKDDMVSRQAAIDVVKRLMGDYELSRTVQTGLYILPSAQPEIIYCKDCKHHWTHSCMDAFPREICDLDQTFYDSNTDYCSLAERRTDD